MVKRETGVSQAEWARVDRGFWLLGFTLLSDGDFDAWKTDVKDKQSS